MSQAEPCARLFSDLDNHDVSEVGGKNASLGEMTQRPGSAGIRVSEEFATGARAYRDFRAHDHLSARIEDLPDASVVNRKYRNMKRRHFPHGGVARRCHSARYVASCALPCEKIHPFYLSRYF